MASYIARALIEAETWKSIQARPYDGTRYPCGCHPDPKEPHQRFYLCDYHDGFDAGVDQGRHDLTAEADRLRAAGDALIEALDSAWWTQDIWTAVEAWQEARRER